MSVWDYLLLAAVVLAAGFAVLRILRRRKQGGCVGCSACLGNCASCERAHGEEKKQTGQTK